TDLTIPFVVFFYAYHSNSLYFWSQRERMDKYTLKTAFKKSFLGVVWRIEVDTTAQLLAIETRDPESGRPAFSVVDYLSGTSFIHEKPYGDRNWALAGVANRKLVVKAFGQNSPNGTGIACIDI